MYQINFRIFKNKTVHFVYKAIKIDNSMKKKELSRVEEV